MPTKTKSDISEVIGSIPYRIALAGGWIDQPFISRHNPDPPGSMVVIGIEPTFRFMDRCGMGTSTREAARKLWGDRLPRKNYDHLIRTLYQAENQNTSTPSGSQDMIGLITPGISRLDYDFAWEGGIFPVHIESTVDSSTARWLEQVLHILPVAPRPPGYSPLGEMKFDPAWIRRLGQTGKDCYSAILKQDISGLGASMNECMKCWEAVLPQTVRHPSLTVDLLEILDHYQQRYDGAMYSGCGGGYLYVASTEPVPGAIHFTIRLPDQHP